MTTFPNAPRLLKGGIVLIDPTAGQVLRIISLQYNPDTLTRTLTPQTIGEGADRAQALRLTGPPQETYKLEVEIDAADQMEGAKPTDAVAQHGIAPQLATLEQLVYPTSSQLSFNNSLASAGTLEIVPMESPLSLFVWSKNRVVPVRLTEFSITEEAFDPKLNPLRAKISLGLRVLNVNDLGFDHKGGAVYLAYHQGMERLARLQPNGEFDTLGITGV